MGYRRQSRELALQFLYQIDITRDDPQTSLDLFRQHFKVSSKTREFFDQLLDGIFLHKEKIDLLIEEFSEHWRFTRIAKVDRNILRIAIFELLFCPDIPSKVTLNEAIDLGKKFGSQDSGSFINGILDKINFNIKENKGAILH